LGVESGREAEPSGRRAVQVSRVDDHITTKNLNRSPTGAKMIGLGSIRRSRRFRETEHTNQLTLCPQSSHKTCPVTASTLNSPRLRLRIRERVRPLDHQVITTRGRLERLRINRAKRCQCVAFEWVCLACCLLCCQFARGVCAGQRRAGVFVLVRGCAGWLLKNC